MKFHVPEMSCGHCTAAITKSISATDPSAQVITDLDTRTVSVTSERLAPEVAAAIKEAGYEATPV
ncbi:MAG: heavy-metal-associated domain-containing protein [Pseudorhodobacter sp.]